MDKTLQKDPAKKIGAAIAVCLIAALYIFLILLDNVLPANGFTLMLIPVLKKGAIYSLICVSMNLLNGFTGLFSLGQAGFLLVGAYAYAIFAIPSDQHAAVYQYFDGGAIGFSIPEALAKVLGENAGAFLGAVICIILAGLVAAVFAALIGIPVLRLKSDYLAIATLGFAEIIRAIFQWNGVGPVTNGSNMLRKYTSFSAIKIGEIKLATAFPFFIAMICIGLIVLLINSSYGRAFKAVRDDEVAAEAMGISLFKHKMLSFVISSFFAGVGGALLAMYQTTIQANAFKSAMTYEILLIVVIGGIGSVSGSCIASFLYIACNEWWLRFLDSGGVTLFGKEITVPFFRDGFRKVVFSVIIMVIVLFFSRGIMGDKELSFAGLVRKLRKKKTAEAAEGGAGK